MGVLDKIVNAATKSSPVGPQGEEAKGISAKKENIAEYNKAVGNEEITPKATPPQDVPGPKKSARYGDRPGEKRIDVTEMLRPLGSFKKGTTHVPKTGMYKLHEGEAVIPKEENTMSDWSAAVKHPSKAKKVVKEIRTRKAKDGSYIHEHHHHSAEHKMEEHTSPDKAAMMAHMEANAPQMSSDPSGADAAGAAPTADPAAGAAAM